VQEHEQLATATATVRNDEDLVQITANEFAGQREAHDGRTARAHVPASPIAQPNPGRDGDKHDQSEG
jgi:hypothetical protein